MELRKWIKYITTDDILKIEIFESFELNNKGRILINNNYIDIENDSMKYNELIKTISDFVIDNTIFLDLTSEGAIASVIIQMVKRN